MHLPISIFTTCKDFVGETAIHQRLAIQSWRSLGFDVLIIGDEKGVADIATELGCKYVPKVNRSASGIPYLDDLFSIAQKTLSSNYLCYLNSDILLDHKIIPALEAFNDWKQAENYKFMTARRRSLPFVDLAGDFDKDKDKLEKLSNEYGYWDPADAIDMFLFSRDLYDHVPPFEIGRMQWDNWLIARAQERRAAIIDAGTSFFLKHPFHNYNVPLFDVFTGEAPNRNRELAAGLGKNIEQARTYLLVEDKIKSISSATEELGIVDHDMANDPADELRTALYYLQNSMANIPADDLTNMVMVLLWKLKKFIFMARHHFSTEITADALLQTINHGSINSMISELQVKINQPYLDLLSNHVSANRAIVIWGCGETAERMLDFLSPHNIPVAYHVETKPSRDKLREKAVISASQLAKKSDKPFILIGSMYAQEIAALLTEMNFEEKTDYLY